MSADNAVRAALRDPTLSTRKKIDRVRAACRDETSLRLQSSPIDAQVCEILAAAFEGSTSIKTLDFHTCKIDADGGTAFARMIARMPAMEKIGLVNCTMSDESLSCLVHGLGDDSALTGLVVNHCTVGIKTTAALASLLTKNTALKTLCVTNIESLSDAGVALLADALEQNATLCELDFSYTNINDTNAARIADMLGKNTSLTQLSLDGCCDISAAGAVSLGGALARSASLRTLDLSWCDIGDEGAAALADGLKTNASLEELSLRGCYITDVGAAALADMLAHNVTLETLDFGECSVYAPGMSELERALQRNTTVLRVYLLNCSYSAGEMAVLGLIQDHTLRNREAASARAHEHESSE